MSEGGSSVDARLASIQGGIDVLRALIEAGGRINDERHARVTSDIEDVRSRVHRHANELTLLVGLPPRVDALESARSEMIGERKGVTNTLKVAWMTGGAGFTALVLAIARKAGIL